MALSRRARKGLVILAGAAAATTVTTVVLATILDLTIEDFFIPGTQVGMVSPSVLLPSNNCSVCHGGFDVDNDPYSTWRGSLMGQAGRDPLFYAQMSVANQDVSNAGYYCLRCHVPNSIITGHAMPSDGSALTSADADGVSCHLCHMMVDPVYRAGISPPEDEAIINGLGASAPTHYGNSMFVLDPSGTRRGPRADAVPLHPLVRAPFSSTGEFCGTCHEVGNVAVSKQANGTYRYNTIGSPSPTDNPDHQFPLERTYSEWKLSAFANGGVDMHGKFGGVGASVVSTCQDCHMPKADAQACIIGPRRPDMRRHEFAGASAQVLDIIAEFTADNPEVDQNALRKGRAAAVSMLQRAASVNATVNGPSLAVRVTNESGHKLPTGHIEGRRVWVNVVFRNDAGTVIREHGGYDMATSELDEQSTMVYEMRVGLSPFAAGITGLPAGETGKMALADTIEKDTRIPPRGFNNAAYEAKGSPVVGTVYADGQFWDDRAFPIPNGATHAEVSLFYQNTPKHYMETLRDSNHVNAWGDILYDLWDRTGRGAPIKMTSSNAELNTLLHADFNHDGAVGLQDLFDFLTAWFEVDPGADVDASGGVHVGDIFTFLERWFAER